ncbi:MAG: LPXTG cell wall anchor domain-containing protein, partial [Ruminococcus sp.]|nr:LPXTG cell wall anchor domain-containing protein [Ruminococcus sp.]
EATTTTTETTTATTEEATTTTTATTLPQTGNNSLTNIITALGAFMMTSFGVVSVKFSGIFRRKENK